MIEKVEQLLASLPQEKISKALAGLPFDWSDLTKLRSGQLSVMHKRLHRASFKTQAEFEAEADKSPIILDMRAALARFRKGLVDGPGFEDIAGED